jgi:hypothetical protein
VLKVSVSWYVKFSVRVSCGLFCMGEGGAAYRSLVGRPEGTRTLGRSRRRWENNVKMDLQEVGWGGMNCSDLGQDMDRWQANAVMNLRVP